MDHFYLVYDIISSSEFQLQQWKPAVLEFLTLE